MKTKIKTDQNERRPLNAVEKEVFQYLSEASEWTSEEKEEKAREFIRKIADLANEPTIEFSASNNGAGINYKGNVGAYLTGLLFIGSCASSFGKSEILPFLFFGLGFLSLIVSSFATRRR